MNLDSFKAYDIRGRIPDEINEALAYDIGRAYAAFVQPRRVAVGYDIRLSSPPLAAANAVSATAVPTSSTSACGAPRGRTSRLFPSAWMAG
jgi:phosphomannomutase